MFLVPGETALPIVPSDVFGSDGPLLLEVGFGNGWFLEHLSQIRPDANILGAEVSVSSVHRAYRRLLRVGATRVRLYPGDAKFLLTHALSPESVEAVFVNFPDPWPRRKHRGRRLLTSETLTLLASRLADRGRVELTTDHEGYFNYARAECRKTGLFEESIGVVPPAMLETRWAKKWVAADRRIFHVTFHATARAEVDTPDLLTNGMQHALLKGELDAVGRMTKQVHPVETGHVIVMEHLLSPEHDSHLFAIHVEESGLKQDILVEAVRRDDGIFVGVRRFGSPLATRGVGESVRIVVEWLETQGLTTVERWYRVDQARNRQQE